MTCLLCLHTKHSLASCWNFYLADFFSFISASSSDIIKHINVGIFLCCLVLFYCPSKLGPVDVPRNSSLRFWTPCSRYWSSLSTTSSTKDTTETTSTWLRSWFHAVLFGCGNLMSFLSLWHLSRLCVTSPPGVRTISSCRRMACVFVLGSTTTGAVLVSWHSCTTRRGPPPSWQPRRVPCGPWWVRQGLNGVSEGVWGWEIMFIKSAFLSRIEPLSTDWLLKTTQRRGGCTRPSSSVFLFWSLSRFML